MPEPKFIIKVSKGKYRVVSPDGTLNGEVVRESKLERLTVEKIETKTIDVDTKEDLKTIREYCVEIARKHYAPYVSATNTRLNRGILEVNGDRNSRGMLNADVIPVLYKPKQKS